MHLVLYDGTCGLCHGAVQFILRNDRRKIFQFAPLQGEIASTLLQDWKRRYPGADTIVLIESWDQPNQQMLSYGKAALRILWLLGGSWALLGVFSFLPSFLSNWIYRYIARNRYTWFGHQECLIPRDSDRKRFLS
ncbi:MAG: thiol-disulfide oxidoreductase DCC family protein [Parachlamydiaceae bacterium]